MAVVSAKLLKNIEESAPKNVFVEISIEFFCPALHYFLQICRSWSCCNPVIGSKVLKNHNNRLKLVRFGAFFVKFRADFFWVPFFFTGNRCLCLDFLQRTFFARMITTRNAFGFWGITYCFVVMAGRFCSFMKLADADWMPIFTAFVSCWKSAAVFREKYKAYILKQVPCILK